jgi:hypothetical protein
MARAGRRRRVLNEEVRAAGGVSSFIQQPDESFPSDTPRYGEQANIEHHPQVTDFVPRRFGKIVLTVLAGLSVAGMAASLDRYANHWGSLLPAVSKSEFIQFLSPGLSQGLIAWSSAVALLVAGMYARLIFMLRRHRVDDYRGRYRVWRSASWLAVLLSINSVLALHGPAARILGNLTGWQLLAGQSGWWLALAVLVCGPLMMRLVIDMTESRAALTVALLAITCYITAGVAVAIDWSPAWLGAWSGLTNLSLPFLGHVLMLGAILINARYVVLDVQGLLQNRVKQHPEIEQLQTASSDRSVEQPVEVPAEKISHKRPSPAALEVVSEKIATEDSCWVNGSEEDQDSESSSKRRLSKSERKRLRKQKARHAA